MIIYVVMSRRYDGGGDCLEGVFSSVPLALEAIEGYGKAYHKNKDRAYEICPRQVDCAYHEQMREKPRND